jgi:hypothetical protein
VATAVAKGVLKSYVTGAALGAVSAIAEIAEVAEVVGKVQEVQKQVQGAIKIADGLEAVATGNVAAGVKALTAGAGAIGQCTTLLVGQYSSDAFTVQ